MRYSKLAHTTFVVTLALTSSVWARKLTDFDVDVTRDPFGRPTPTRAEYLARFPERELRVHRIVRHQPPRDDEGTVLVLVNHRLLENHIEGFAQYTDDLAVEGYDPVLIDVEGGTPADIKQLIIEEGGGGMVGAVLAGDIALAWFEQREHFDDEDEPDNQRIYEYPIDLFYMDLDGEWQDTSGNDIYDVHLGAWEPDIWVGRLPGHNLSRIDEDELIGAYLERVHLYRTGDFSVPHRTLNFIDDDWKAQSVDWEDDLRLAFGNILTEAHPETTSAVRYSSYLGSDRQELVQVAVHSTTDSHLFRVNDRQDWDYFRFRDLRDRVVAKAAFYNLFACSAMDISYHLCMGALYALGGECGLGAVGSTKTGGMLFFEDYYQHLGDGLSFGESLRLWLASHGREPDHELWARSWFYGMTHFGDPTLKIKRGLRSREYSVDDPEGDNDGSFDAGERVDLGLNIINLSESAFEGVIIHLSSSDSSILVLDDIGGPVDIAPSESAFAEGLVIRADPSCQDGDRAELDVTMTPSDGEAWHDRIRVVVRSPRFEMIGFGLDEIDGDGDGWTEPGETGTLSIRYLNSGGDGLRNAAAVELLSLGGGFEPLQERGELAPIESGGIGEMANFPFRLSPDGDPEAGLFLRATIIDNNVPRGSGVMVVPSSSDFRFSSELDADPAWGNHYAVSSGYKDIWRWDRTAGEGSGGIAAGGPDTTEYLPFCDAAFELPLMMMEAGAVLEIRHRFDIEEEYDAAVVEIDRGGGWERAEPEDGYNGNSVEIGNYQGGRCWNGEIDWTTSRIPIAGAAGALRIRFRFASDAGVEAAGWYIDRAGVDGVPLIAPSEIAPPNTVDLTAVYPNPFNDTVILQFRLARELNISFVIFDATGRLIADLGGGAFQAGAHRWTWNRANQPAGVYFARLDAGGTVFTKKLTLLK